jgi:hypothetical protein
MLRPMVRWSACLRIKHPSGAYDQIFITVRQLQVCWCGAISPTRGGVCRLQLLLALTNAVILGSESRVSRDHILLPQIRVFPFCHLLRLFIGSWAGSIENTACIVDKSCLLRHCPAIDVLLFQVFASARMCLVTGCLAMGMAQPT